MNGIARGVAVSLAVGGLVGLRGLRIVIDKPTLRVYVGDETEPSLVVRELTNRTGGRVGLWMGNNSGGSFADLVIRQAGG